MAYFGYDDRYGCRVAEEVPTPRCVKQQKEQAEALLKIAQDQCNLISSLGYGKLVVDNLFWQWVGKTNLLTVTFGYGPEAFLPYVPEMGLEVGAEITNEALNKVLQYFVDKEEAANAAFRKHYGMPPRKKAVEVTVSAKKGRLP